MCAKAMPMRADGTSRLRRRRRRRRRRGGGRGGYLTGVVGSVCSDEVNRDRALWRTGSTRLYSTRRGRRVMQLCDAKQATTRNRCGVQHARLGHTPTNTSHLSGHRSIACRPAGLPAWLPTPPIQLLYYRRRRDVFVGAQTIEYRRFNSVIQFARLSVSAMTYNDQHVHYSVHHWTWLGTDVSSPWTFSVRGRRVSFGRCDSCTGAAAYWSSASHSNVKCFNETTKYRNCDVVCLVIRELCSAVRNFILCSCLCLLSNPCYVAQSRHKSLRKLLNCLARLDRTTRDAAARMRKFN